MVTSNPADNWRTQFALALVIDRMFIDSLIRRCQFLCTSYSVLSTCQSYCSTMNRKSCVYRGARRLGAASSTPLLLPNCKFPIRRFEQLIQVVCHVLTKWRKISPDMILKIWNFISSCQNLFKKCSNFNFICLFSLPQRVSVWLNEICARTPASE